MLSMIMQSPKRTYTYPYRARRIDRDLSNVIFENSFFLYKRFHSHNKVIYNINTFFFTTRIETSPFYSYIFLTFYR